MEISQPTLSEMYSKQPSLRLGKLGVNWTPLFEWNMAKFDIELNACFVEIGLLAEIVLNSLSSTVNTIGRAYGRLHNERTPTLVTSYNFCISTLDSKLEMTIYVD